MRVKVIREFLFSENGRDVFEVPIGTELEIDASTAAQLCKDNFTVETKPLKPKLEKKIKEAE